MPHILSVTAGPEYPPASLTASKLRMSLPDVVRDIPAHVLFTHCHQGPVTAKASIQQRPGCEGQAKLTNYLLKLLPRAVGLDHHNPTSLQPGMSPSVPGEKDSSFVELLADHLVAGRPKIQGVIPKHSQPPCQFPEHAVGNESLHGVMGCTKDSGIFDRHTSRECH